MKTKQPVIPTFKIGDSVKVKKGIKEDYIQGYSLGGFQGRIFDLYRMDGVWYVEVEWDSITLKKLKEERLRTYIREEVDYACHDFGINEMEPTAERDTLQDVKATRKVIQKKFKFVSILDEQDIWSIDPGTEMKDYNFSEDNTTKIAKARERAFVKMFEKIQKKGKKEAKKTERPKLTAEQFMSRTNEVEDLIEEFNIDISADKTLIKSLNIQRKLMFLCKKVYDHLNFALANLKPGDEKEFLSNLKILMINLLRIALEDIVDRNDFMEPEDPFLEEHLVLLENAFEELMRDSPELFN